MHVLILVLTVTSCAKKAELPVNISQPGRGESILLVGTYTRKESHVDGKAAGFYVFRFDTATGNLVQQAVSPPVVNPSYLAIQQGTRIIAVVSETQSGMVYTYTLPPGEDTLIQLSRMKSGGDSPCHVAFDNTGKTILVANYGTGTISAYNTDSSGYISEPYIVTHTGIGPTGRQTSAHAHMVAVSPDNRYVYSCDLGADSIFIYRFGHSTQLLLKAGSYATAAGAGPRHMVFHPFLNVAYVTNELNGTVEAMSRNAETGKLSKLQAISAMPAGSTDPPSCADIRVTPSGRYLYVSNRGQTNNLAIFAIDPASGKLVLTGHQPALGMIPRSFVIHGSEKFLIVANQNSDNLVVFRISKTDGRLVPTGISVSVPTPVCLAFMSPPI